MINLNFNARYQNFKKRFQSKYDPDTYWEEWGRRVNPEDDFSRPNKLKMKMLRVNTLLKYLETLQFNSVLDYGCGWGFVTKFLLEKFQIDDYVGFDASPDRIKKAKEYLQNFSVDLKTSMIGTFETEKKFDLVLGIGVLHHIQPEKIKSEINHLLKFTKNDFIHEDPPVKHNYKIEKSTFNFFHNYEQIYEELGYDVKIIPIPNHPSRLIYHVKVN